MTEPSHHKRIKKTSLYGMLAAAAVAAALLTSYALGAFDSEPEVRIQADDVCSGIQDKKAAAQEIDSLLPKSGKYDFRDLSRTKSKGHYIGECYVVGDQGDVYLHLVASLGFKAPKDNTKDWESRTLKPLSRGEVIHFDAGLKGTSASNLAGIYVPCFSPGKVGELPYNLTVFANAEQSLVGSEKVKRQKLVNLALDYAHTAHKQAKCDRPSKLPDRVTAPGE
ncbi:hypothetical protein ACWFRJ_26885 [Streptomyces sp. NPDC055239]